ncbi:MAG: hypothetical protein JJE45_00180 [Prolixibacteraceae bacterium]|nr:hypothetical protein [Prolixibacteraceae bacterium]
MKDKLIIKRKKHGQTYEKTEANAWFRPIEEGYKMACCDCGLVHDIDFKVEGNRAWLRVRRNNRSTAMVRRHKNK